MSDLYRFGPFALDPRRRTLSHADSAVSLTPKAFDVLLFLVQNPNRLTDGFPNVLGCATLGDVPLYGCECCEQVSHALAHDGSSPMRHTLCADGAVSSLYFRSRPYNCVRVIPNRRAAFDLFPSDSDRTSSMVRRSMSV